MTEQTLSEAEPPLSPIEYWQETMAAWQAFGERSTAFWTHRMTSPAKSFLGTDAEGLEPDSTTTDLLRSVSDLNMRHWQNTARFMEGMPGIMKLPQIMTGSALTDWFDNMRRNGVADLASMPTPSVADVMPAPAADVKTPKPAPKAKPKVKAKAAPRKALTKAPKPAKPAPRKKPSDAPDDLTLIKGVGPKLAEKLNAQGIYQFQQIAKWTAAKAQEVDDAVAAKGRTERDDWMSQARALMAKA